MSREFGSIMGFTASMKKVVVVSVGLFLFFSVVFTLALAQEASPLSLVPSASPQPVDYALPYPGILPDHPLYIFKRFRDTLLALLITNPVRKVEFQILQADKHLNMGVFLVDKGKTELALKTTKRSVDYLDKAKELLFQIPAEKSAEIGNLKERFERSLLKHKEVIGGLENLQDVSEEGLTKQLSLLNDIYEDYQQNK